MGNDLATCFRKESRMLSPGRVAATSRRRIASELLVIVADVVAAAQKMMAKTEEQLSLVRPLVAQDWSVEDIHSLLTEEYGEVSLSRVKALVWQCGGHSCAFWPHCSANSVGSSQ